MPLFCCIFKRILNYRSCEQILNPILYSFRRCPYAIRARYCLAILDVRVEIREVVLKNKPDALLLLGGRTSVPQLIDSRGQRFAESLDIIFWSLENTNNQTLANSLWPCERTRQQKLLSWIHYNDHFFKYWLDRYKYADRYPEFSEEYYRCRAEVFLRRLEGRLKSHAFIMSDSLSLADICLFPFVRQFAAVDHAWFNGSRYVEVRRWLSEFLASELFSIVMTKYEKWEDGQQMRTFPD